jgi:prepilin-type N-terminal cleavage/methylation domain-containing protein
MRTGHAAGPAARRRGHTVVEVLVVVALLAVLAALTAGAVLYARNRGPETATAATLKKLDTGLLQQWQAVIDSAQAEYRQRTQASLQGNPPATLLRAAGGDPDAARKLWVALRLKQEFPTTYSEATAATTYAGNGAVVTLPAKSDYARALGGPAPGPEESSACLFAALALARRGMVFHAEEALGAGSIRTVNGRPCFVDAWGAPLAFVRHDDTLDPEILSAGGDGRLGSGDDVSSLRLRPTGRRGD